MVKRGLFLFLVATCLSAGVTADEQSDRMIEMCAKGIFSEVRFALEEGANPNYRGADGTTPLLEAVKNRWYPIVRVLLDSGSDPDIRSERNDPVITYAASFGDLDVTRALIEAGAEVDARDTDGIERLTSESGVTALWIAARRGEVGGA